MRKFLCLLFLASALLLLSCNRSVQGPAALTSPAVNTLIAAGTIPPTVALLPATPSPEPTRLPAAEGTQPTSALAETLPASGLPEPPRQVAVILLGEFDLLNVRAEPGLSSHVLFTLPAQQRDLQPTGQRQQVDDVVWAEVNLPDGGSGWVSAEFLTEQVDSDLFCQDPQVSALLDRFITSVKERDSEMLPEMVSPAHGLTIYHNVWNPPVSLDSPEVLRRLYISTVDYDWGLQEGSGEPLVGPFKDMVFPKLKDVLSLPHTSHCNILEQGISAGGTTGLVYWPAEYTNLNYIALYRAAPASQELNWRTWVAGIEYVNGIPYLAVLIQFYWEI